MTVLPNFDHLHPATRHQMIDSVLNCLPYRTTTTEAQRESLREDALRILAELDPRTPVEAMLASIVTSLFFASINCGSRALEPGVDERIAARLHKQSAQAFRMAINGIKTLTRHRDHQQQMQAPKAAHPARTQPPVPAANDATAPNRSPPPPKLLGLRVIGGGGA